MHRILLIEDDQALRATLRARLQAEGYEVVEASGGASGIELACMLEPDLVICDIGLPEFDGYSVLFSLRSNSATSAVPFIFLTGRTREFDRRWGMELGADEYLTKPFSSQQLLAAVSARIEDPATMAAPFFGPAMLRWMQRHI